MATIKVSQTTKHITELLFVFFGIFILLFNNLYIAAEIPFVVPILNLLGGLIAVFPPMWVFYSRYTKSKEIEKMFIIFIRDLTESINSGMTLPMALSNCGKKDYGYLQPFVDKMIAQVDWGIPFKKALMTFADSTRSTPIRRSVSTIIQTYKVGGKVTDTLNAVGQSLITIDKIKKERTSSVHSQIITSYMIFFVFIFILIILQTFLLPALSPDSMSLTGRTGIGTPHVVTESYDQGFVMFIIIQGFFAGLATGKMSEGSIIAGFKHSILLIAIGYTLFSMSSQLQIRFF